jgi:hypothetical protein
MEFSATRFEMDIPVTHLWHCMSLLCTWILYLFLYFKFKVCLSLYMHICIHNINKNVHFYMFNTIFFRSLISNRPYMSTINIFLCLLGASRAVCLFIDPYNLKETMPKIIGSIIWDIGYPCITSAFCLIQLAFLQLTKVFI